MKNHLPLILIYARLIMGLLMIILSATAFSYYSTWAVCLLSLGLLTDIFDGIIARKLGISTQKLRRLDSSIDQVFFISVGVATFLQCPAFFKANAVKLVLLLSIEGLAYAISFLKFRKEIATHSLGAKLWTLLLVATLIQVMVQCQSVVLFNICFWVGLVTRLEIIAIVLALKTWTNDVPTFYHSLKLRQNKPIKRHKIFNG